VFGYDIVECAEIHDVSRVAGRVANFHAVTWDDCEKAEIWKVEIKNGRFSLTTPRRLERFEIWLIS
jgi:hypothetical protein